MGWEPAAPSLFVKFYVSISMTVSCSHFPKPCRSAALEMGAYAVSHLNHINASNIGKSHIGQQLLTCRLQ